MVFGQIWILVKRGDTHLLTPVSSLLANGSSVANSSGHLFAIGQAYLVRRTWNVRVHQDHCLCLQTTDGSLAGVVRLPTFALLLLSSSAVRPLNGSRLAGKLLRKWAESQFGNNVSQVRQHTHTHSHTLAHSHSHTLTHSHTHTRTHSHTHTLTLTRTHKLLRSM